MLIKEKPSISSNEITAQSVFESRRQLIKSEMTLFAAVLLPDSSAATEKAYRNVPTGPSPPLQVTDFEDVSHCTNYYEFTNHKTD